MHNWYALTGGLESVSKKMLVLGVIQIRKAFIRIYLMVQVAPKLLAFLLVLEDRVSLLPNTLTYFTLNALSL